MHMDTPISPYAYKKILFGIELGKSLQDIIREDTNLPSLPIIQEYIKSTPKRNKDFNTAELKAHMAKTAIAKVTTAVEKEGKEATKAARRAAGVSRGRLTTARKELKKERAKKAPPKPPVTQKGLDLRKMDEVWRELSSGRTLTQICSRKGFPSHGVVLKHIRLDPEAKIKYDIARQAQGHRCFDKILDLNDDINSENSAARKIQIDTLKWAAGRLAKEYDSAKPTIDQSKHIHMGDSSPEAIELKALKASQQEQQNRLYLMANKQLPQKETPTDDTEGEDYIDV